MLFDGMKVTRQACNQPIADKSKDTLLDALQLAMCSMLCEGNCPTKGCHSAEAHQIRRVGICGRQDEVPGECAAARGTPGRAHNARPARWEALLAQAPLARGLPPVDEDHHVLGLWQAILLEDLRRWAHLEHFSIRTARSG